jgi:hypothetical protein
MSFEGSFLWCLNLTNLQVRLKQVLQRWAVNVAKDGVLVHAPFLPRFGLRSCFCMVNARVLALSHCRVRSLQGIEGRKLTAESWSLLRLLWQLFLHPSRRFQLGLGGQVDYQAFEHHALADGT